MNFDPKSFDLQQIWGILQNAGVRGSVVLILNLFLTVLNVLGQIVKAILGFFQ